jgi:hypothetical protein
MLAEEWADSMVHAPDAAAEAATTELPLIHDKVDNE